MLRRPAAVVPGARSGDADVVRGAGERLAVAGVEQVDLLDVQPQLGALAGLHAAARVDAGDRVTAPAPRHVAGPSVRLQLRQLLGLESLLALLEVEVRVDLRAHRLRQLDRRLELPPGVSVGRE